jgi:membrane protease YdiL (CAAX protease family)
VLFGITGAVVLLGVFGIIGLIVLLALLFTGNVHGEVRDALSYGGVYAETFAIFLLLYIGLSFASLLIPIDGVRLLISGVAALLSLTALAWPVVRGMTWRDVRQDIGLTAGRRPALEPALGVGAYAMALPLFVVGFLITRMLMLIQAAHQGSEQVGNDFSPIQVPSHPVVVALMNPDWWVRLQVLLLGCLIAPLVEETMFRGVLYCHLRAASARFRFALSFLLSAAVTSFVFATIHPQGWVTIPALASLAFGFCLAREWRGTLVPGMIAHGIHNGVLLTIAILAFSD